jgi:uncharacterized protein
VAAAVAPVIGVGHHRRIRFLEEKTMTLSLYDASIPLLQRGLENLSALLTKAEAHAAANGIAEADLISARLAEDMFPLSGQVQSASDAAKACVGRLSGQVPPGFPDTETTFAELQARIRKTLDYLAATPPEAINGREDETVTIRQRSGSVSFTGVDYLRKFALPNFFFHVVTGYDVLRHKGVPLGKSDYLGAFA